MFHTFGHVQALSTTHNLNGKQRQNGNQDHSEYRLLSQKRENLSCFMLHPT